MVEKRERPNRACSARQLNEPGLGQPKRSTTEPQRRARAAIPSNPPRSFPCVPPEPARLQIDPCDVAAVLALERELGVSHVLAQVLVRRGFGDAGVARAWLAADERHEPSAFAGIEDACALVLRHAADGRSRITIHGDYDVDGVASTAILIGVLRGLGADVDWFLPSRAEDGYGLSLATVERLAARGTRLLITADCAITAVAEVAAARAAGIDVVVTDHHSPRADGVLPDALVVHPAVCGYPCADLCAAGVAYKLAAALLAAAGRDAAQADADLDLVALATIADCVPLRGENRRLVRAGLRALATTTRPGLRALMRVARADPARIDARAVGFRLAPRINAAGRLERADAGLELLLTTDDARAAQIADELDRLNAERRHTETRILFEAEAQVARAGERPAYVLTGEGWHKGVIGIVASRIAERHHRPTVLIALDAATAAEPPARGTGSGRSIAGFDLLAGLDAAARHLVRHGGHRAAAGCEILATEVDAFRAAFEAHAAATLRPEDLVPVVRADAVVAGDELGLSLAEELERLAPFGTANPGVSLLMPAARFSDARTMGEGKHARFSVEAGGVRAGAVAFGVSRVDCEVPLDATFSLELNEYNGSVEPRLVLRDARACAPAPIVVVGEPRDYLAGVLEEIRRPLSELVAGAGAAVAAAGEAPGAGARAAAATTGRLHEAPPIRDRRGGGIAGTVGALVASGEPVLVVAADAILRARHLAPILGGFELCSHAALERDPGLARRDAHVVVLDPPAGPVRARGTMTHLAWGPAELRFAEHIHERQYDLRAALTATYRVLRDAGGAAGEELEALLRGDSEAPRPAVLAGRLVRVLVELHLVSLDPDSRTLTVPRAERTALERSAAYRAYQQRYEDGRTWLNRETAKAA
ncbi:MAG: single-stranded-DNA-specific exonuclease [Solirubrobacteraceae bacterium]|jgi:single-stranded-DNA-specific exonuclease|nr:single-stranded-DNA-specific exonuclease [Solirubrobacteraceae bacterium]